MKQDVRPRDVALQEMGRFLAACYYQPGPEFGEEKVFDSIVGLARVLGPDFEAIALRLARAFGEEDPQDLLVDYTRLFLGPVDVLAQPYEASWTAGAGTGPESIRAILALYDAGGFGVALDFRERPDHLAAELEFLYLLRANENRATAEGRPDDAGTARGLRRRLLSEHLARWAPLLAAAMRDRAQTAYYRELAALTGHFVAAEARELG
jgi:putative dimethyl sulfoxide reductase chaperone